MFIHLGLFFVCMNLYIYLIKIEKFYIFNDSYEVIRNEHVIKSSKNENNRT